MAFTLAMAAGGIAYFGRGLFGRGRLADTSTTQQVVQSISLRKEAPRADPVKGTEPDEPSGGESESESATKQGPVIPGADWVLMKKEVLRSPVGAEGLGEIFIHPSFSDEERAELLAAVAMNRKEDPEVRMEALDQWLKMLPEGADSFFVSLAKDDRMDPSMCAILLKDTISRSRRVQAEVALVLLQNATPDIKDLAREQLVLLAGADYGPDPIAWQHALDSVRK